MDVKIYEAFASLLPAHQASLHLKHNQHRDYYESAVDYLADNMTDDDFIADGERERCIATDSIWELQWYPNTPVGFNRLVAASLVDLLAAIQNLSTDVATEVVSPSK